MRARDAVGRRIVAVEQSRAYDRSRGEPVVILDAIVLDNGTRLLFSPHDDGTGEWVEAHAYRNRKDPQ